MKYFCLVLLITSVAGRFTDDFYQLLARDDANKNIISSPLSVEIAMAMLYIGAKRETAQEMRDVLKLSADKEEVICKYKDLLTNIEKKAMLHVANRMYVKQELYLHGPEYIQRVRDSFKTDSITIKDRSDAPPIIKGFKYVKPLLVALSNDVYFKNQWRYAFNSNNTKRADFRTADKKLIPAQMMSLPGTFKAAYIPDLDAKVIELPYRNSSLSMVVFLPEKVDGLPELEKKIVGFSAFLPSQNVNLKLPKFQIAYTKDLKDTFKTMGIRTGFSYFANFRNLSKTGRAMIDQIDHRAIIEVDERGAEAAAESVVFTMKKMLMRAPSTSLEFSADHPFAFVIRDKDIIYLQGHFVSPGP